MSSSDRIALLEQRIVELEGRLAGPVRRPPVRRPRLLRRMALIGLVLALTIPAGVVLANHQFADVPTGSSIHDDVEAIADAGVTFGCGDGQYCPANPVTRGQMAQFLNRLGALDGQPPVVNADRLDGLHADDLTRTGRFSHFATDAIPTTGTYVQHGPDFTITAPTDGFAIVNAALTVFSNNCTMDCSVVFRVAHVETGDDSMIGVMWVAPEVPFANGATNHVFPVEAGVNTFQLQVSRATGDGTISTQGASATVIFSPFGGIGAAP